MPQIYIFITEINRLVRIINSVSAIKLRCYILILKAKQIEWNDPVGITVG